MDHRPSILMCGPSRAAVSGVATHLNQLFDSSLSENYALIQFQVGSEGRNEARLRKMLRYLLSPIEFVVALIRFRPAIVHLNTSMEAKSYWRDLAYLCAARLFRRKVVYQVHGGGLPSSFLGENPLSQAFLRATLWMPDAISLLAEVELEEYRRFKAGRRLDIVPNAIRLEEYAGMHSKQFDRKKLVLGYIGRLADDKGVRETIEAIATLRRGGDESFRFQIAGSGPDEAFLRDLVRENGVDDIVDFLGPVFSEDKMRFWEGIDIFVFPTFHREGLPYTILEALASGTPTLSTRVGGIPDVIQDGVQGVLLDDHEPASVARAIEAMLLDRQRLRDMSVAALQRASDHYGVERLASQFDRIYRELLA